MGFRVFSTTGTRAFVLTITSITPISKGVSICIVISTTNRAYLPMMRIIVIRTAGGVTFYRIGRIISFPMLSLITVVAIIIGQRRGH